MPDWKQKFDEKIYEREQLKKELRTKSEKQQKEKEKLKEIEFKQKNQDYANRYKCSECGNQPEPPKSPKVIGNAYKQELLYDGESRGGGSHWGWVQDGYEYDKNEVEYHWNQPPDAYKQCSKCKKWFCSLHKLNKCEKCKKEFCNDDYHKGHCEECARKIWRF